MSKALLLNVISVRRQIAEKECICNS